MHYHGVSFFMDNTWVKLYRKLGTHPIMADAKALQVFIWILCRVDYKTGSMTTGRFIASQVLDMNPNTFKDVLKRLEDQHQIITTKSTNRFTVIQVRKWDKYQGPTPQRTPQATPSKHHIIKEYKNNKLDTNVSNGSPVSEPSKKYGNKDVGRVIEEFCSLTGLSKPSDREPRRWAYLFCTNKRMGVEHFRPCLEFLKEAWPKADILKIETVYRNFQVYERDVLKPSGKTMTEEERRRAELYANRR